MGFQLLRLNDLYRHHHNLEKGHGFTPSIVKLNLLLEQEVVRITIQYVLIV